MRRVVLLVWALGVAAACGARSDLRRAGLRRGPAPDPLIDAETRELLDAARRRVAALAAPPTRPGSGPAAGQASDPGPSSAAGSGASR